MFTPWWRGGHVLRATTGIRARLLLGASLLLTVALAQSSPLDVVLERFQVVETTVDGEVREELRQALELVPGDELEEALHVENVSDDALEELALVIPVPDGTAYVDGSAVAVEVAGTTIEPEFSYDGGVTYGVPPLIRIITVEQNGQQVETEVLVTPEEYTHARWVLPVLEAETTTTVRLRAVVR